MNKNLKTLYGESDGNIDKKKGVDSGKDDNFK